MNFTVYSKEDCPYCYKVKQVLELTGSKFVVYTLGQDFTKEEFYAEFGKGTTFPQVICNDKKLVDRLRRSSILKNKRSSSYSINNNNSANRGVDYILSGGKSRKLNTHAIRFGKIFNFFRKEIHFYFEMSLGIKKQVP